MAAAFRTDQNDDSAHPLERMLREVTIEREHLPPGTAIGSFVLKRVIERDDFGLLYLATASASSTEVAIEEYLPAALATRAEDGTLRPRSDAQAELLAAGLQAFLQESEQLGRIHHPALMRIGPVWQTRGTAFRLRLELPGSTLAVRSAQTPVESWLRGLALPLLGALERLHEEGLVHGNVRPGRIMIRADGAPLLMDFGAARDAITALAPWLGAPPEPEYRAPELHDARRRIEAGPPADLYALAAVLRYCITGEAPLAAARRGAGTRMPRLAELLPQLRQRHAGASYSDSLVGVIDRAMALDPSQRPQSAAEFRAELERMPPARPFAAVVSDEAGFMKAIGAGPVDRRPPAVVAAPIDDAPAAGSMQPTHPLQVAARAASSHTPPATQPAPHADARLRDDLLAPLQAVALQERQRQQAAPLPGEGLRAGRDEPSFDFPLEPETPPQFDLSVIASDRGTEPQFAATAAPRRGKSPRRRSASDPWSWALGGLLIGILVTAAFALGLQRIADDARLAWTAITSTLPGDADAEPTAEAARLPSATGPRSAAAASTAASGPVAATALPPLAPAAEPAESRGVAAGPAPRQAPSATATLATPPATGPTPPATVPTPTATAPAAVQPPPAATTQAAPSPSAPPRAVAGDARESSPSATAAAPDNRGNSAQAAAAPTPSPARAAVAPARAAPPTAQRPTPAPAAAAAEPPERATVAERPKAALVSPAAACAPRSNFSLYQCMKVKCQEDAYYVHPQCIRLRRTDEVS